METLLLQSLMGRRPQQQHAVNAAVAQTTAPPLAVDDKGDDVRVALVGLTLQDDAKTHASRAASAATASLSTSAGYAGSMMGNAARRQSIDPCTPRFSAEPSSIHHDLVSSEESDDTGYEDDLDNTPVAKWKRRRRQRINTTLMPYPVAKKTKPFSSSRSSGRALPSLSSLSSSSSENQPGLANAGLERPVLVLGPDERQRQMAQATRRLANLRAQSAIRQWREKEEEEQGLGQQQEPRPAAVQPTETAEAALARAFDGFSLSAPTTEKEEEPSSTTITATSSARALCERIRQQARRKLREERKRVLLARQVARDEARKHAAASPLTTTTTTTITTTALIPVTEASIQERRLAFAESAAAFQRQQRVQAALDAWQQLAAAAAAKQELERELRLRLEAAAVLLGRLRLRGALRTWRVNSVNVAAAAAAAVAAEQQAIARGVDRLAATVQRRALRAWQCAVAAAAVERAAVKQQKALPPPLRVTVTGAGEVKAKGKAATAQQRQAGQAWWAAACGWFRDELARVVAPPRRRADADEYLDCM